jgi:arylsulfatase B/arylsulfatase I/J
MLRSVVTAAVCMAVSTADLAEKPNIIMMVIDDLGFNDIGYMQANHGFVPTTITPTIDKMARGGVQFEQYYVDTVCSPTRATLLTGRYPIHNSINDFIHVDVAYGLPLNETTLPTLLKAAGYRTHAIGKWHLGYSNWEFTPTFRGFDSFYG